MILFFRKKKKVEEEVIVGVEYENVFGTLSPKGGVGKTSLTVETAFMLAMKGARVVLVDWDVWSPRLTVRLLGNVSEGKGLLDIMLGDASPDEVVKRVEYTTPTGQTVGVDLVPAASQETVERGEVKKLSSMLEEKYHKVKERVVGLIEYLARTHDVVFNDYPVPTGPAPAPYHKIAASSTHWLNVVIDAVPTTAEYAARYVELFYPSLPIYIVWVNMIKPVHHEYTAAVSRASELCKMFASRFVVFVPFDGKLYDVKVSGAAPPAVVMYKPEESAALRVLRDAAMRILKKEKPQGCVAIHLKVM